MIPTTSSGSSSSSAAAPTPPVWSSPSAIGSSDGMFPGSGGGSGQQQLAISNGVLLAAVIFLFMVVVFVFLLYLYAKRYLGANPLLAPTSPSSRFLFVASSPLPQRGLPASVLRSLPVTVYGAGAGSPKDKEKDALECAVCLSEVADGEKVRTLPNCGHGFHVECIDMWFHSHDTCPLCRAPVGAAGDLDALPREEPSGASLELPVFPTNVLFWGTHDEVTNAGLATPPPPPPLTVASASAAAARSSASSGLRKENQLVIDIPTRPVALNTPPMNSPLPASRMPGTADDMRSPVSARLRSLRRLLSRGKQAVVGTSSYSPSPRGGAGDIEQGLAGAEPARPPKTPPSSAN
ncbi:RING-H2 finger protein ATL3-like [Miscanthus floridulus]|uniref:RING-H2 finger protein ATL3-like n=1 Tax=Miscanthus floridulus TaxID=154761 RepID=UPI003457A8A3